jgi:hypothetical protein
MDQRRTDVRLREVVPNHPHGAIATGAATPPSY